MYAFIHIPKTGGATFRHLLRRNFGAKHLDIKAPLANRTSHEWISSEDLRRAQRVYPALDGICGHRVTCFGSLADFKPDLRFFTFVREPIARFVSHFTHHVRDRAVKATRDDFLRFCEDPHQQNVQCRWIGGIASADTARNTLNKRIGFVGLTEQYDVSLLLFQHWLGAVNFDPLYEQRNISKEKLPFDVCNDEALLAAATNANAEDLSFYRYICDTTFPAQLEAYGPGLNMELEKLINRNKTFSDCGEPLWAKVKRNFIYKLLLHLQG